MTVYATSFVSKLLSQRGDHYLFSGEIRPGTVNPDYYDCSEFGEWGAHMVGGYLPDGSAAQIDYCRRKGTTISVATAMRTPGALLYKPGHVAYVLSPGKTIEARGKNYGVGVFSSEGRGWAAAAKIPGMVYGAPPKPPSTPAPAWPGRFITQPPAWNLSVSETRFQQRLKDLGLYGGPVDSLYGPSTESATRVLQQRKGLVVDGIVGDKTWYAAWRA